jgi:coenzyme F420-reducing hydrogenase alpha subunit
LNILNNHNFRQNIIDSINDFKEIIHEFIEINKTLNNIDNNVFNDYVNGNSEDNDTYSYDENDHYTDDDITDELNEINIEDYNNIYEKMSYNSDDNM